MTKYDTLTDLTNVVCSLTVVLDDTQHSCLHQGHELLSCHVQTVVLSKHQHPPSELLTAEQCFQSPAKQRHD